MRKPELRNFLSGLLSLPVLLIIIFSSCTPPPQTVTVDYNSISVPEEGGISFTKYTREDEKVAGPYIGYTQYPSVRLVWYAAPFIGLSPDGEKLAYIASANNFLNLYIKNVAGGKSTVQRTFNRHINDMSFSPDGTHIAFTERRSGNQSIYMINATEGAAVQQVTATSANELGPTFSPDGKSIYFSKEESGRYYVWNVNLESSLLTQYSEGFTPVLTPDGTKLIVTRNGKQGGRGEIWMIDIKKGTETMILSDPDKGFSSPAISPDGKTLVVVGITPKSDVRPENLDLYSIKLDGTGLKQLTFHGGHDVSPQWDPDGESIFFISQRGNETGKFNVWKMNYRK